MISMTLWSLLFPQCQYHGIITGLSWNIRGWQLVHKIHLLPNQLRSHGLFWQNGQMQPIQLGCCIAGMYSTPSHMIDAKNLICGVYVLAYLPYKHVASFDWGIYVAFDGHICIWHIYYNSMWNKCCTMLIFWLICAVIGLFM